MYQLSYRIDPEHYKAYAGLANARMFGGWPAYLLDTLPYFLIGLILAWALGLTPGTSGQDFLKWVVVGELVLLVIVLRLPRWLYFRFNLPKRFRQGELRLTANEEGIETTDLYSTGTYAWNGIEGVSVGKDVVVIWVDKAAGLVVPLAAFQDISHAQQFCAFVQEKIEAGGTGTRA
ncbi:MAG: YcxB family protein [Hyphomicrobiaceae bacterium]